MQLEALNPALESHSFLQRAEGQDEFCLGCNICRKQIISYLTLFISPSFTTIASVKLLELSLIIDFYHTM